MRTNGTLRICLARLVALPAVLLQMGAGPPDPLTFDFRVTRDKDLSLEREGFLDVYAAWAGRVRDGRLLEARLVPPAQPLRAVRRPGAEPEARFDDRSGDEARQVYGMWQADVLVHDSAGRPLPLTPEGVGEYGNRHELWGGGLGWSPWNRAMRWEWTWPFPSTSSSRGRESTRCWRASTSSRPSHTCRFSWPSRCN